MSTTIVRLCPNCKKNTTFDRNSAAGDLCCTVCGVVVEDSHIVSEISFGESSTGAAVVHGSFVSANQSYATGAGGLHGNRGESRTQTIEKTRNRIFAIASAIGIRDDIASAALQYFHLALNNNFVKGRKSQYVVSACLYLACRVNGTNNMLLDFAEAIYVNVFAIGATYLQLVKSLTIESIPVVDPSLYIQRFVRDLDFDKEGAKKVMNDAARLVQRMGKDWIHQGRRPTGVAAACVLLAARMNNYRRSKAEIVYVAKIAEETLQRRLEEFKQTKSSEMTVHDFRKTDISSGPQSADPPAYTRARLKEQNEAIEISDEEEDEEKDDDEANDQLTENGTKVKSKSKGKKVDGKSKKKDELLEQLFKDASESQARVTEEMDRSLADPKLQHANQIAMILKKHNHPVVNVAKVDNNRRWISNVADDPEDLGDVDDDEIDSFILDENEAELKSAVWMSLNRDYLVEQESKRLKIEADKRAGTYKEPRRKKPRGKQRGELPETAAEGAMKMIKTRAFSKKLNYDVANNLFKKDLKEG